MFLAGHMPHLGPTAGPDPNFRPQSLAELNPPPPPGSEDNLVGRSFGSLEVFERIENRWTMRGGKYRCRCRYCGLVVEAIGYDLSVGNRVTCGTRTCRMRWAQERKAPPVPVVVSPVAQAAPGPAIAPAVGGSVGSAGPPVLGQPGGRAP